MGKTTKANDTILAAALEYAARGWVIFPARFELDKKIWQVGEEVVEIGQNQQRPAMGDDQGP